MKGFNYLYIAICICLFSCAKNDSAVSSSVGKGGSLARFTIAGNYLYGVSNHYLFTIDITDPAAPVKMGQKNLDMEVETIYPFKDRLYLGSRTGMFVYSIDDPSTPTLIGQVNHIQSCDPVVANDTASYSTLKGGRNCGLATSGLYVYDLRKSTPELKKLIPVNEPIGLGIADSALYVCAGGEGLKVFSLKKPYEPIEIKNISGDNYIDVIPYNDLLICWTTNGIVLHDITDRFQPLLVNKIPN